MLCSEGGAGRKKRTIADFEDDDDSKGSDFKDKDIQLEADEDEGTAEGEPELKPTPKQKARAKKIVAIKEDSVEKLSEQVSKMTLQNGSYSMTITCPYIMYDYVDHGRKLVSVDFLVPNHHIRFFRLGVVENKILELRIVIPKTFYNAGRLMAAHADNKRFTKDTHKATAFAQKCQEIVKEAGVVVKFDHDTGEEEIEVLSGVQQVALPFDVEEDLYRGKKGTGEGYQVIAYENDDDVLFAELEEPTDLFILSVDLVSNEKKKKKKARGTMRKIKSPVKNYSDSSDDNEEEAKDEAMEGGNDDGAY